MYFDQNLGAAHSKHWLKYAFLTFVMPKAKKGEKRQKFGALIVTLNKNHGIIPI